VAKGFHQEMLPSYVVFPPTHVMIDKHVRNTPPPGVPQSTSSG
jgi:hypothetical protein